MNWLKSRYTKFLEAELTRQRMEKDARIRELIAEKLELLQKIGRLETLSIPGLRIGPKSSTAEMTLPASHWQQALEAHNRVEFAKEESWQTGKSQEKSSKGNGPADASESETT